MLQKLIQYNFNACAATYLQHAQVQKIAAQKIIHELPNYYLDGFVLDLGSGPGTILHEPEHSYPSILYDFSLHMLKTGIATSGHTLAINGDAGVLPFATSSIATVISNLMIQWTEDKSQILEEVKRVLLPNGVLLLTTLIQPSLWQLKAAWSNLDSVAHTLDFLSQAEYGGLIESLGLTIVHSETWETVVYFSDIYAMLRHFKLTGTTMPKSNMSQNLLRKNVFKQLENVYCRGQANLGLALSYQYLFIIVKN